LPRAQRESRCDATLFTAATITDQRLTKTPRRPFGPHLAREVAKLVENARKMTPLHIVQLAVTSPREPQAARTPIPHRLPTH